MQDRLADLGNNPFATTPNQVEITIRKPLDAFYQEVDQIKTGIQEISAATQEIRELSERNSRATTSEEEHEISKALQELIQQTNQQAADAKGLLQKIKKDSAALKKDATACSETEHRIRENMYTVQTRKFMDAMKEYQKIQQQYKADIKKKVKRQVQIVKPDATNEEIDMVLRSGDTTSVYKAAILQGSTADPIRDAYANCQEKYQDILRLEQSVAELHQMFMDLALLVDQQGEMLDQIGYQVKSASEYIESGNQQLSKAIQHQTCARKKKCCLLIFGLVLIMIATFAAGVWN